MAATKSTDMGEKPKQGSRRWPSNLGFILRFVLVAVITGSIMAASNVNIGSIGQGLALSLVGVGVFITFRVLNFPDLSVDGSFPIGGAVAATLIASQGIAAEWTLFASFMAGALTGLVTALIHVLFKIEGLLASIIVATGAYTITLRTMGTSNIPLLNERTILTPYEGPMRNFVINTLGPEARRQSNNMVEIVVFLIVVTAVMLLLNWFLHTEIGLTLRAAGRNAQMVRALGANDKQMVIIGLMISNGLAGLAGGLAVQQLGFADVQMGIGMIIRGLAAVMIGEVLLRPRRVGQAIVAAAAGMVIFDVSRAWVFSALDLQASDVRIVSSLVVLAALAAPNISQRWRSWRHKREQRRVHHNERPQENT
jgi:putative ABC transport system permease protein